MKKVKKNSLEITKFAKIPPAVGEKQFWEANGGQAAKADSLAGLARKSGASAKSFGWRISGFGEFCR